MDELPKVFVAADGSSEDKVVAKLDKIAHVRGDYGIKVNFDLVYGDLSVITRIKERYGKPLFVDNKTYNGKRTMGVIIQKLADLGVEMTNIYAHADNMMEDAIKIANEYGMTILGVTVLTHHSDAYCRRLYGKSIGGAVRVLTEMAIENGCHGVILPGTTLSDVFDIQCIKFNPAVRPDWFDDPKANFQEQIMDHREAMRGGADIVSCGSPIFKSSDPAAALSRILAEIN